MIGESPQIKELVKIIDKVAASDSTVLITGESGTGKELVAKEIHRRSRRHSNAFVPINCGAIPKELLESELFGYEKGAFTGANRTKPGRFELANGGTVFLDEIGDMSPDLQVKVLRVLQERAFERVGGIKEIHVDVRIVAATNRDLERAVKEGRFREDLYYRLNVIPIRVPPLRERRGDIPLLIHHFNTLFAERAGMAPLEIDELAMEAFMAYSWPGNVRELENLVERLMVLTEGNRISLSDLPERIQKALGKVSRGDSNEKSGGERRTFSIDEVAHIPLPQEGISLPEVLREFEIGLIKQAILRTHGVKSKAAKLLGLKRTTLVEKMKKFGML